jgi:oxygen-independent coproporphyrinogen-3 oxidase
VDDIFETINQARKAGFTDLNLDLMIGLPGEDAAVFEGNIKGIKITRPEQVAVYMLEELDEVPFKKVWDENPVPEEELARTYENYQATLGQLGYEQYEISNYARPGYACRHNLKYWKYEPVIGLGPSSASHLELLRWQNVPDLKLWSEAIFKGQMNLSEYLVLSRESALKEKLMSGLRLAAGIDWELIKKEYSSLDFLPYEEKIRELAACGSLEITGSRLRLPPDRFLVANSILSELLF